MNYNIELLEQKKQKYLDKKKTVKDKFSTLQSFENDFLVRFTHDSTAIEGNTLTMEETRDLLLYERTPDGKTLREIHEQIDNKKEFSDITHEIKKDSDLILLLKKIVSKMDMILNEYGYDQELAWNDQEYQLLKKASDNLSEGVQKVERARFFNQSFIYVKDPYVSEELEDYVDWKLVDQVKDII